MNWTEIYAAVEAHAVRCFPNESCGIILRSGIVVPCTNVFEPPTHRNVRFQIDPVELRRHNPQDIRGFYHSHPNGSVWLSEFDGVPYRESAGQLLLVTALDKDARVRETKMYMVTVNPRRIPALLYAPYHPDLLAVNGA